MPFLKIGKAKKVSCDLIMGVKKNIKDFLYSPNAPEWLSHIYFKAKDKPKKQELLRLIEEGKDLMEGVKDNEKEHWLNRINNVLISEDNKYISRHKAAGTIVDDQLIMHNGLKVDPMSYYGFALMKMLIDNKGVHEPQEEKVFQEVLKNIDRDKQLIMMELGAYWSFYSMWLLSIFPDANCYMVEPDKKNLYYGKQNFKTNNFSGNFIHGGIGKKVNKKQNVITVDKICEDNDISFIDLLHSDIQGYELEMLQGSEKILSENKIGYVFISTHSNELHYDCKKLLERYNFKEVTSVDIDESYAWDGILVMKASHYEGLEEVEVTKRKIV